MLLQKHIFNQNNINKQIDTPHNVQLIHLIFINLQPKTYMNSY